FHVTGVQTCALPILNVDIGGKPLTYVYNGTHWEFCSVAKIKSFAEEHFNPKPTEAMRSEFVAKIMAQSIVNPKWFEATTHKKIKIGRASCREREKST